MLMICGVLGTILAQDTEQDRVGDGTLRRIDVPILMYHYVGAMPEDPDVYRVNLTISPERFREHMQYLHDNGYSTISLYHLHDALMYGTALPANPIVLTFDDGYADHYNHAFPILREHGFAGTFFIITGRADIGDPAYLNWGQIQEMHDAGMYIESHTKTHPDLRGREFDFLVYEILGSLESITAHTQYEVRMFSYPAGRYDESTLNVIASSPVQMAVTTQHGSLHTTDGRFELQRLRISGDLSIIGLAHLLNNSGA